MGEARFSGKVAIVTGGANGIGAATARRFLAEGAQVAVIDREEPDFAATLAPDQHARLLAVAGDCTDADTLVAFHARAEAAFGPVDILFNNAGIASFGYELADMAPEAFDQVVAVNLTGVFNGISAFAAGMRERGRGHVVNTSSMAGICASSHGIGGNYSASKFGVVGLSETLRAELAPHGVGVSVLCPGMIATGIATNSVKQGAAVRMPVGSPSAAEEARTQMPFESGVADELAPRVLAGIEADAAYIISHGKGWWPLAEARHVALEQAFEGMR